MPPFSSVADLGSMTEEDTRRIGEKAFHTPDYVQQSRE